MALQPQFLRSTDRQVQLSVDCSINHAEYHEKLNVILAGTTDGEIHVLDPNLGDVLYSAKFDPGDVWDFIIGSDRVVVASKGKLGIRSEYNGILLLNTILQTTVDSIMDYVEIELTKMEAELLCQAIAIHSLKVQDVDVKSLLQFLKAELVQAKERNDPKHDSSTFSVKKEKWNTVIMKHQHSSIKTVIQGIVSEFLKRTQYNPQLSIASSILERLNALRPPENVTRSETTDKSAMFSEAARINTFLNWPHRDYKWAHPVKMAQAGFYHSPSSTGEDRAMCFTCNVCLVSWEPTDEPWSEHERHSPFCPFVRGEHTHNVPLTLSYSTSPAIHLPKKGHETPILGKSSCQNAFPMCYAGGQILIYDTLKQPKEVFNFEVSMTDLQDLEPMSIPGYSDIDLKPEDAWIDDIPNQKSISISNADCFQDFTNRKVRLNKVALISSPTTPSHAPPSLVVAGGTVSWDGHLVESWILVFGLSPNTFTAEEDVFEADSYDMDAGGTRKETTTFEDELFAPFLAESDMIADSLMSDSMTVFSESNMSDSSYMGMFQPSEHSVPPPSTSSATKQLTPSAGWAEKGGPKSKSGSTYSSAIAVQKLVLPVEVKHCQVMLLEPTPDKTKIVVVVGEGKEKEFKDKAFRGAILIYQVVVNDANIVALSLEPISMEFLQDEGEVPIGHCFIPMDLHNLSIAFVLGDGNVRIYNVDDLYLRFDIPCPKEGDSITSAVYCSSIEKLWFGTESGYFHMYSIDVNDGEDENLSQTENESSAETEGSRAFSDLILNKPLNTASLQQLRQLTKFENVKIPFSVNTPACWQRVIQAQKERKHPLHLHSEGEWTPSSFSWRLQRNKDSRKEHLFEITFPKTANVGHIDFKFSLQSGCTTLLPFEITLYMARNVAKKGRQGQAPTVDQGIDFGQQISNRSLEFLKSANAEIVCGPLQLANHLDISAQGGAVVMTSPTLLLSKGRNYFLHLKATKQGRAESSSSSKEQKLPSPKKPKSGGTSKCPKMKSSSVGSSHKKYHPFMTKDFYKAFNFGGKDTASLLTAQIKAAQRSNIIQEEMERRKIYEGCDWLHEISISVKQVKEGPLPNSELERKAMVTSPEFVRRLLQVVTFHGAEVSFAAQSIALDLLNWIAGIKLCGPQLGNERYQLEFIEAIEQYLGGLVLKCILFADRSTAHKCAKLLILCFDVVEVYHKKTKETTFLMSLLESLIGVLQYTLQCSSAGALQWYFLLLNQVRTVDPSLVSAAMLDTLNTVSKELLTRADPLHAILRSRFGLYGTPFDPDLFDLEESSLPKLTLNVTGNGNGPNGSSHGDPHGFGPDGPHSQAASSSKDFDIRDLLLGNPLRHSKFVTPKQQIHGLIEVEALHFTCHAASDGARVEKMETGGSTTFSPMPMPSHWEPFTNVQTGEGSKKSDLYKSLSKLDKMKMIDQEAYYDYLNDVKMLEGNLNLIDMMTFQTNSNMNPNAHGFIPGMLQDSAGNSYNAFIHQSHLPSHVPKSFKVPASSLKPISAQTDLANLDKIINLQKEKLDSNKSPKPSSSSKGDEGLRLLMSPWQQMMYVPNQQALIIDRMHSGARRYVVLDFGCPILLTDLLIPPCSDLASLSIDLWLKREDIDGQRLVVASDIATKPLIFNDIQPPPICRYLKITTIGRYGMGTMKCKIPLGMFYGHSAILPNDIEIDGSEPRADLSVLSPVSTPAHLSVLAYVLEDLGCRYQLACGKLKRLLEPLAKPEIASIDHISYFLPKGKERAKLGLSSAADQTILSSYQDCITLQQQLNVTKNVIFRLQRSMEPYAAVEEIENPLSLLQKVSTDKIRLVSMFLVESLLGISFMSASKILETIPYPLYTLMTQSVCSDLFQNICVLENSQFQHAACTFLLRTCSFQPWWGNFLTSTLKNLFSSSNTFVFPQDRVFTLLVYLSQRISWIGQKSCVVESTMKLLEEIVSCEDDTPGFTRAKIDMNLLGWTVMFLCLSLDGMTHSVLLAEDSKRSKRHRNGSNYISSRWNFIQGESVLHESLTDNLKSSNSAGMKRRIPKKMGSIKQKLNDFDEPGTDFGSSVIALAPLPGAQNLNAKTMGKAGWKQHESGLYVSKGTSAKTLQDLLLGKDKRESASPPKNGREGTEISDIELNLNLNPKLCYSLTKALGSFLLKMDSTCHSDIYLLLCKALARISTSCRPAMRLGEIFTENQILRLVQTGVGNDFVNQVNWSSSWISHAIMCLIQDLLDGERRFPESEKPKHILTAKELERLFYDKEGSSETQTLSEPMVVDATDADAENDGITTAAPSQSTSATTVICLDSESDYESLDEYYAFGESQEAKVLRSSRQEAKEPTLVFSLLSSLDSRMDSAIDSSTEIRLRMISAIQGEVVVRSLADSIDVPSEVSRSVQAKPVSTSSEQIQFRGPNSLTLLSSCFDELFRIMAHENCNVNIEKVLLFWLSINVDTMDNETCQPKPSIPLSPPAISGLITALARNVGIGIEDWGSGLKCLGKLLNQGTSRNGIHLAIITDPKFPEMILKFITGSGMNLMRNHVSAMGPTVCEDFDIFFTRLFSKIRGTTWMNYLLELLLRVLSEFLSGPILGSEFPLDAFNKFVDIFMRFEKDLPTTNPAVLISIVDHVSHALHRNVCFPSKVAVKSNAELKGAPTATTSNGISLAGSMETFKKPHDMELLFVRLLSLLSEIITVRKKSFEGMNEHEKRLREINFPRNLATFEEFVEGYGHTKADGKVSIADLIVQMDMTMMRLFSVLANPKGKSNLLEDEVSHASSFCAEAMSLRIPDFMIRLISRLMSSLTDQKQIVQPLFKFLAKSQHEDYCCPLIVSQMFVRTILKVIKEEANLQEFVRSNCVQSICQKLVASSKQFFSSCPTFASILMQYIGRAESSSLFGQRRYGNEAAELAGGVINVAPLGTITALNFSAHPSEVLLQATPPHRRARAPVWSYHFYPEETFLELIITLPCAILLKEIQIVPHISSLATSSPAAVMVEISKERGGTLVAKSPPVQCGGMTAINIQLSQPEVGQSVLLRLYKPKDSNTLGLSQIKILGCTTFCESAFEGLSQQHLAKNVQSSAQWMYILDHAIIAAKPDLRDQIIALAVNIPDILQASYSMLMCPTTGQDGQESYLPHVSSVLFHFGSLSDINQQLMDALLGPVQLALSHGMTANTNVQSVVLGSSQLNTVVELIYKLCCAVPTDFGCDNLTTVIHWLEKCADEAVTDVSQSHYLVPEYVQSIAAAVWSVTVDRKVDISDLVTSRLLVKLLNWSKCLNLKSELKAAVDHMICSMCYNKPWLFVYLNYEMGILEFESPADAELQSPPELIAIWYEEKSICEKMKLKNVEMGESISSPLLMTLARAAQSEPASVFVFDSGLLTRLNAMIIQFLNNQTSLLTGTQPTEILSSSITTPQLIAILEFYVELCSINRFKDWFGLEGSIFWNPILHLLSMVPSNMKASCFGSHLYELEYIVIQYLARCCWSHPENQKYIAKRLSEMIVTQKQSPHKAVFLHSLSSFCRRLLIQVLLENEKMVVQVKNSTTTNFKSPVTSLPLKDRHPSMGVNGKDRIFLASIPSTAYDLMKLLDPTAVSVVEKTSASFSNLRRIQQEVNSGWNFGPPEAHSQESFYPGYQSLGDYSAAEVDVLHEILGFETVVKMGMKAKKARGVKSQEVVLVAAEPEMYNPTFVFEAEEFPDVKVPLSLNLSKIKAVIREQNPGYFLELLVIVARNEVDGQCPVPISETNPCIAMDIDDSEYNTAAPELTDIVPDIFKIPALPTTIEVFCKVGGFSLLAKHLPVIYPDTLRQMSVGSKGTGVSSGSGTDKGSSLLVVDNDWVKVENPEEYYEENDAGMLEGFGAPMQNRLISVKQMGLVRVPGIPPHSMAAFGLFLGLPNYAEVLLKERVGAQCMLRLAMGITDDADGNDIFCSVVAKTLPTLPFQVLRQLLDLLPLKSEEGKNVRQAMYQTKAIHFILACLAIFTHQPCDPVLVPSVQHELVLAATKVQGEYPGKCDKSDDKSHVYWAKGTGFGTGSTQETWNVERAMEKRVAEEENVTCLLLVLSSYICPQISTEPALPSSPPIQPSTSSVELPQELEELLQTSCLFTTISLYLKNDSVLDMARHIPLYTAVLQFLRSLLHIPQLVPLLDQKKTKSSGEKISTLLHQMKTIVDSYSKRLTNNAKKGFKSKNNESVVDELHDEGLAKLIADIQSTATLVEVALHEDSPDNTADDEGSALAQTEKTLEDVYLEEMKNLQFGFFEMLVEEEDNVTGVRFTVSHFYENSIRTNWSRSAPARLKRLAQESITLSTSLPIAYGSTIFVRCDTDRLDVMKVLITGPAATPYSNGCFEFDVYFPMEYPNGPMLIHLQTTGRQRVRFNPNLYADGKVCLSILNTWHGRPEEKWNSQTSSLLPVLVAIQSLILNAEPYFNEPGYEKSRGTEGGEKSSREYNAGIQIATLEWAMLDQVRHPSVCFKEVIHKHFWLKRNEILAQCDQWYEDLVVTCRNDKRVGKSITGNNDPVTVFKNNLSLLRKELLSMTPPAGLEYLAETSLPQNLNLESELGSAESSTSSNSVFETSMDGTTGGGGTESGPIPVTLEELVESDDVAVLSILNNLPEPEDGGDVDEPMLTDSETS